MWCFSITFSFLRERCRSASASPGENIFRAGRGAGVQCFPSVFWCMFVYEMCVRVCLWSLCKYVKRRVYACVWSLCLYQGCVCLCILGVRGACLCVSVSAVSEMCMICVHGVCTCVHAGVLPVWALWRPKVGVLGYRPQLLFLLAF